MKKVLISSIAIIAIIIAIFLIYKLLNPTTVEFNITTTTKLIEKYDGYKLIETNKNYTKYSIDNIDDFDINIKKTNIKYNKELIINNNKIIDNIKINNQIALYDDLLVIIYKYNDKDYQGILEYNIKTNKYEIIYKIDNLYIDKVELASDEMNITLTNIFDNKIIINDNKQDICSVNAKDLIVSKNIYYYYDNVNNVFSDKEELGKLTLESYKASNNICNR